MHLGNWQIDSLNGGLFWLDGGVMFGVVPKTLWSAVAPPDSTNRIQCANNCVLARDGTHTILIDTGYGGKFGPLDRKFYQMESGEPLLESLAAVGVAPDDIDTVIFSHLHFDHVCGATRFDAAGKRVPIFSRARHIIGRTEWEDATGGAPELVTAYPIDDILPLYDAGLMMVIEDGQELLPGVRCRVTGGHTRGHMAIFFESGGQTAAYLGDICPSTAHMRRMWHLAYDTYPVETRRRKPEFLGRAADEGWWILWNHDPRTSISRVARDEKREFVAVDAHDRK
ncbi:MAG TPA: MBL fold metallo-hydrolase [Pirellulales bacterium]|jgi:glyoxylase-like metal-dependent hydrolase (beta-lactamase superfamily II)|nr:MBL fold metallo-hydrolase [Pirellulales bacterium]